MFVQNMFESSIVEEGCLVFMPQHVYNLYPVYYYVEKRMASR